MDDEEGVFPERTVSLPRDPPVDLPPRMRTRRTYIRRMEVEKYGPTRGCPGCQKVTSDAVPSCIVATHNDECRERMEKLEKLMMQDPEGADRVVRTKTRISHVLARHIEEHDERAKKIAKHDHLKASSGKDQASSSSSSGVEPLLFIKVLHSGASDTCRQQWTFVSMLLCDAP